MNWTRFQTHLTRSAKVVAFEGLPRVATRAIPSIIKLEDFTKINLTYLSFDERTILNSASHMITLLRRMKQPGNSVWPPYWNTDFRFVARVRNTFYWFPRAPKPQV